MIFIIIKMSNKKSSPIKNPEEKIIKIIKEVCRVTNLKPEDWQSYGPKVIKF